MDTLHIYTSFLVVVAKLEDGCGRSVGGGGAVYEAHLAALIRSRRHGVNHRLFQLTLSRPVRVFRRRRNRNLSFRIGIRLEIIADSGFFFRF